MYKDGARRKTGRHAETNEAAALRGGNWNNGTADGVFSLNLDNAPSGWNDNIGSRCVVPSSRPRHCHCPRGYGKTGTAASFLPASIVCKNNDVQVVKAGTGASAFWIDRYEASVWTAASGGALIADNNKPAYASAVRESGRPIVLLSARSLAGATSSRIMTWLQAARF